jgi:hypothetical protein
MTDILKDSPTAIEPDYRISQILVRQQPLSIVVDIDDVLFPWYATAHRICQEVGLAPEGVTPTTWNVWKDYGCEPEQWWAALRDATLDGSLYLGEPYEGAIGGLWRLEAAGHHLHLVTARGTHTEDPELAGLIQAATVRWVAEHFIPHDTLTFSKDKTVVPADFAVDDNLANYDALEAAGVVSFLVNRPWNAPTGDGRRRVDSLAAFAAIILGEDPA